MNGYEKKTAQNTKTKEMKWLKKARRSVSNGSERCNGGKWWCIEWKIYMRTPSVVLKTWLWVPNKRQVMALNVERNDMALNIKLEDK